MQKTPYTDKFFEERIDVLRSAEHIVPLLLELIQPKSVVDVGCGTGEFLYVFKEKGIKDILGIDGEYVNKKKLRISENSFLSANLEKLLKIDRKFDLVVSLEVAEHLSKKYARTFIDSLTNLGPVILFSAAIPFQGGTHHVNEQWPEYWANLFEKKGYIPIDCIRRKVWNNNEVSFWYAQNILLFVKKDYLERNQILQKEFEQTNKSFLSIVHPELYLPRAKRYNFILKLVPYPIKWIIIKLKNFLK